MAQFDVYRNPRGTSRARYLLDVQHNVLGGLKTRVVVPLLPLGQVKPMTRLNPVFDVEGDKFVMSTPEIAGLQWRTSARGSCHSIIVGSRSLPRSTTFLQASEVPSAACGRICTEVKVSQTGACLVSGRMPLPWAATNLTQ